MPDPFLLEEPFWNPSRIISLFIFVVYVVISGMSQGNAIHGRLVGLGFVGVACIWFPGYLGSATGFHGSGIYIGKPSPELAVWLLGWLVLAIPGVAGDVPLSVES